MSSIIINEDGSLTVRAYSNEQVPVTPTVESACGRADLIAEATITENPPITLGD